MQRPCRGPGGGPKTGPIVAGRGLAEARGGAEAFDKLTIQLGRHPRVLRTNNAGEMCGSEAQQYYTCYNIKHERCSPHEHNQNPRAE
eukprot:3323877-Rhodomonas_salina.2